MERLRETRKLLGMSQFEMCKEIGCSLTTYRHWESEVMTPGPRNEKKITDAVKRLRAEAVRALTGE